MKNGGSAGCLMVNQNGRTNFVGVSAQAPERLRGLIQIHRLTDDFIARATSVSAASTTASGCVCTTDIPLRMAFQSVSSRNVTATSIFSVSRGGAISNSNPLSKSNAARLGELDASTNEGIATNSKSSRAGCNHRGCTGDTPAATETVRRVSTQTDATGRGTQLEPRFY